MRIEWLEPRSLLSAVSLLDSAQFSTLAPLSTSTDTGEKPQAKVWEYADEWWSVLPNSSGTWLWRLDGTSWEPLLKLSSRSSVHADVKAVGDLAHVLLYNGIASELVTIQYSAAAATGYAPWTMQPEAVDVILASGVETATIDVDGMGRLWLASDATSTVEVRYSDYPYTSFSNPVTIASNINSDDISTITSLPNGAVGVLWSNQNAERFGFRSHQAGDSPTAWSANEVPASQSALSVGDGMADDHLNLAVASNGTVYAAVKTSYDTAGYPKIALLVRRPNGNWDSLYTVSTNGTRPIVVLNEHANRLVVAYTEVESGGDILCRESPMDVISFGPVRTLISGTVNNATSTKGNFTDALVVLAGDGSKVYGTLLQWPGPNLTPTSSGFVIQFSDAFELAGLNLYDGVEGTLGPADVILQDGAGQAVVGSLVVDSSRRSLTFVKTGGVLTPGTYTVTVKNSGSEGDDFTGSFIVVQAPDRVVSIPDIARGAGQPVNIPNTASGLPIRLDNVDGVTSLAVDVVYDEDLLDITAATLAAGLPADWTVVNPPDTNTHGVAKIRASGTTPLSGTDFDVVRITAAVPGDAFYGASQAIRLENVSLNGGAIAAVGDVAVHKAVYLGDADGTGIHSSADAFLVVQAAVGLASGFPAHAWTDPQIVGDADGSGLLSAVDADPIVQEGLGLSEPFLPDNPHTSLTPVSGPIDPQFQIGVDLPATAGGLVTVPVKLDIQPAATNVGGFDFDLLFDPRLSIQVPDGILAGADTADRWALSSTLVAAGHLRVGMLNSQGQPLAVGLREIARLLFRVEVSVGDGPAALDIEPSDPRAGGYVWTAADGSVLIAAASEWHNPLNPFDVDEDGVVAPADVLSAVNYLNAAADAVGLPLTPDCHCDVNNDHACTPLDVLATINYLNVYSSPDAESEGSRQHLALSNASRIEEGANCPQSPCAALLRSGAATGNRPSSLTVWQEESPTSRRKRLRTVTSPLRLVTEKELGLFAPHSSPSKIFS